MPSPLLDELLRGETPSYYPKPKGFIGTTFDVLARPAYAISEAVGAARSGQDVLDAMWDGLRGKRKHATLGYQAFPEAEKPGFQAGDIGAFAIDVLTDPLTWVGPGVAKAIGKPVAKGILGASAKLLPKFETILPEITQGLTHAQKIKALTQDMKKLHMGASDIMGRMDAATSGEKFKQVFDVVRRGEAIAARTGKVAEVGVDKSWKRMLQRNEWVVDEARDHIRRMDANMRPLTKTALGSLASDVAMRMLPVGVTAARFGGPAGKKFSEALQRVYIISRQEAEPLWMALDKTFKGVSANDVIQAVRYREMGQVMRPMVSDKAARLADDFGGVLDYVANDLSKFRDQLGNPLMVINPVNGKAVPFEKALIGGYYPHRWDAAAFTKAGRKQLYDKLLDQGHSPAKANSIISRLSTKPKRLGHIEMARLADNVGYELDARKVLPKYIWDVTVRKNMAKEFGVNNEVLEFMMKDMRKTGMSQKWISQVSDLITGRRVDDRFWEQASTALTSFQAISKLGYATSIANFGQAPLNQFTVNGAVNTVRAMHKIAKGDLAGLGSAAFSRASREDFIRGMMGGSSTFMNMYMKAIGFNWTERVGRHAGAIGGYVDMTSMAKKYADNMLRAATGNKRAIKEAGRLQSELMRKYKIPVSAIDEAGKILDESLINNGSIMAADKTMHSFFPGDLPPGWRSPFWRTVLQFKSFIYKQNEFMVSEVFGPGLKWLATDGAQGDIMPMLRAVATMPVGAEIVQHARDFAKSVPSHVYSYATEGKPDKWDYKKPFWEDPDPAMRVFGDIVYVGSLGILGDAIDSAAEGRLWKWATGPTISDIIEGAEAPFKGKTGEFLTRELPGAAGIPYGTDIFEALR